MKINQVSIILIDIGHRPARTIYKENFSPKDKIQSILRNRIVEQPVLVLAELN